MTVSQFRTLSRDNTITIPLSSVRLAEPCHCKAFQKDVGISTLKNEPTLIVRHSGDTYTLVVGYRDYITAKNNAAETVKAVVVPDKSRNAFLRSLLHTFEMWNTADVHEPKEWESTPPSREKVHACVEKYEKTGTFGKKIKVLPDGTVVDGYAALCAARLLNVEKIPVYVMPKIRHKE